MSGAAIEARLWAWQRISAAVLALCVPVHFGIILYAVRGGLSAAEILGRTRGNLAFTAFYALFVAACAVHVPTGLLAIAREWLGWRGRWPLPAALACGLLLLVLGWRAVYGVTWS